MQSPFFTNPRQNHHACSCYNQSRQAESARALEHQDIACDLSSTHPSAFLSLSRAAASKCLFFCSSCLLCFSWIFKKKNKKPTYWVRFLEILVYPHILTIITNLNYSNRGRSFIGKLKTPKSPAFIKPSWSYLYNSSVSESSISKMKSHMDPITYTLSLFWYLLSWELMLLKSNQISRLTWS